jgi:catechol 2,3-dioxygenase-like lactoylglutathione lyase family enzyme
MRGMQIEFVASFAVVTPDPPASRKLFVGALGLPLKPLDDEYWASQDLPGSKHFGIWPLQEAAQACFGRSEWPSERTIPQASVEFEVQDANAVQAAAAELRAAGFELLHDAREEPWGQTVARLLSLEGLIVGISYAPSLHHDIATH